MRADLTTATAHARRLRRTLVRNYGTHLGGYCALASVLLADALDDIRTLRMAEDTRVFGCGHVWNVVGGVIVDITATQFDDLDLRAPKTRGVLVTPDPKDFHRPVTSRGLDTFVAVVVDGWADGFETPNWKDVVRKICAKYRCLDVLEKTKYQLHSAAAGV